METGATGELLASLPPPPQVVLVLEQRITWKELEQARLLKGTSFTSELLRRFVIETLPQPVREAVTQRILLLLRQAP